MGRAPCCDKANVKKGPWSPEEDAKLKEYIDKHGTGGNWIALPQKVGLRRCGKSCRLRWLNYLRPNIKHGEFSDEEDRIIINLFANIGSRWSIIAAQLPGRTDNDIKNYWNTKLKKKLMGIINNNNNNQPNQIRKMNNHGTNHKNNNNIPYLLQPSSSSPSSSPSYTSHYQQGSLITTHSSTTFDPNLSSPPYSSMNIPLQQQSLIMSQMQHFNQPTTSSAGVMMFGSHTHTYGADQPSCSSSEGSQFEQANSMASNGIVSLSSVNTSWAGSTSSATVTDHQASDVTNNNNNDSELDYGLEEIKQLISSTNSTTSSCGNNFLFDENKADQEKVLYYYY